MYGKIKIIDGDFDGIFPMVIIMGVYIYIYIIMGIYGDYNITNIFQ